MKNNFDCIIVGGGLAGGLTAYRLALIAPRPKILLIDSHPHLGQNQTWTYIKSQILAEAQSWFEPFYTYAWSTQTIRFTGFARTLNIPYRALASHSFSDLVAGRLGEDQLWLNQEIEKVESTSVWFKSGENLAAPLVIDAREWIKTSGVSCGYRKSYGQEIELEYPHRLEYPIVMDTLASEEFSYFSILPITETRIFIQNVTYSLHPEIEAIKLEPLISDYIEQLGWCFKYLLRVEKKHEPIPFQGELSLSDTPALGSRAGLFHATTGESVAESVETAELVSHLWPLGPRAVSSALRAWTQQNWQRQSYYRKLNQKAWNSPGGLKSIFRHIYRQSPDRILRFHSGEHTWFDRVRLFSNQLLESGPNI